VTDDGIEDYQRAIGEGWHHLTAAREIAAGIELADASRFLAALAEGGLTFVHADPARPVFVPWVTADRRWADNGQDSAYWYTRVDGAHRYRIHGERRDECYLSFTVYAGSPAHPEHVALNLNHRALEALNGDRFSFEIEPPADACYVIARQYFQEPSRDRPATLAIDVIDGPAPSVDTAATIAAKWRVAADFIRTMSRPPTPATNISYASQVTNEIGNPSGWREAEGGGRGTPDQTYALGRFQLGPEEALVMDTRLPECGYASVVVWNQFGQSIDRRLHTSTLNHREMLTRPDGTVRVVVAHTDPGVPNWLDAAGREAGTIFWRFLLAGEQPARIESCLVNLADVQGSP
jgi:hypothetical protein